MQLKLTNAPCTIIATLMHIASICGSVPLNASVIQGIKETVSRADLLSNVTADGEMLDLSSMHQVALVEISEKVEDGPWKRNL